MKKAQWEIEETGRLLIALALLVALIGIIYVFRDKAYEIVKNIGEIMLGG